MSSIEEKVQEYEQSKSLSMLQKGIIAKLFELDTEKGVKFTDILAEFPDFTEIDLDDEFFELAYLGIVFQPAPEYYRLLISQSM